jgi:hypothetical protein
MDRVTRGRLYHRYYEGKDAEVDDHATNIMSGSAGSTAIR